jgi:hypothetical protein
MPRFTVEQGKRYAATVHLDWLKRWASNDEVARRLRAAGFTEITVSGSGAERQVEATWPHADASADIPSEIDPASILAV